MKTLIAALALLACIPLRASAAGSAPQPSICVRSCWGSRATATNPFGTMSSLNRAIVHHTANASNYVTNGLTDSKAIVRATQNWHMDHNGWSDIGYHFLVDKHGNIFEGLNGSMTNLARGAHDGVNANSFGFSCLGNYHAPDNQVVTSPMLNSLCAVIAWRMPSSWRPYGTPGTSYGTCGNTNGYVDAHRRGNCSTSCPGDIIYYNYLTTNLNGGAIRDGINSRVVGVAWDAAWNSQSFPLVMAPGSTSLMWSEYKNTGSNTWLSSGGNSVRLGTSSPRDATGYLYEASDWLGGNRATAVDANTAPGAIGRFTFVGRAPTTPGFYVSYWELVAEGISWFEGAGDGSWYGINVSHQGNNIIAHAENFTGASSGTGVAQQSLDYYDADSENLGGAYRTSDVDINALAGGGWAIGYTNTGEWTRYYWNCTATGTYRFKVNYSNGGPTGQVNLQIYGGNAAQLSLPSTGSYSTFVQRTVDFTMNSTGMQELKLYTAAPPANYDWFAIDKL